MVTHLRVYSADLDCDQTPTQPATVRVRLGDLLPLVALAQRQNYLWLQDFVDDEIRVTADLYDVLLAFKSRRPAS